MNSLQYPDRLYLFSDTFGGQEAYDPLRSPDADARIVTDIRSSLPSVRREFDTFGAPRITDHILRTIARTLRDSEQRGGMVGVFINSAPRTEKGSNGKPFYRADTDIGLRVVATPLEALSPLREHVTALYHLPNEGNGLYGAREQFRSSFTVALLADDHGLPLVDDNPADIPPPEPGCVLAYVDRFGNMMLHEEPESDKVPLTASLRNLVREKVIVTVGIHSISAVVGESLADAFPGDVILYPNDHDVDLARKWEPKDDPQDIMRQSAFLRLLRPSIGSNARVVIKK
jgi:hypothetical protein